MYCVVDRRYFVGMTLYDPCDFSFFVNFVILCGMSLFHILGWISLREIPPFYTLIFIQTFSNG